MVVSCWTELVDFFDVLWHLTKGLIVTPRPIVRVANGDYNLDEEYEIRHFDERVEEFQTSLRKHKNHLLKTIFDVFRWRFIVILSLSVAETLFGSFQPYIVYKLLQAFQDGVSSGGEAVWLIAVSVFYFVYSVLVMLISEHAWSSDGKSRQEIETVIHETLYRKLLRVIDHEADKQQVISLVSTDLERLSWPITYLFRLATFSIRFIVAFLYVVVLMGIVPALVASFVLIGLLVPLNYFAIRYRRRLDKERIELGDERVALMNEVIRNIRFIKSFGWEELYKSKIQPLREEEVNLNKKGNYAWSAVECIWHSSPFFLSVATIVTYALLGHPLTISVSFTVLSVVGGIAFPIFGIASSLTHFERGRVSLGRLHAFLNLQEIHATPVTLTASVNEGEDEDEGEGEIVAELVMRMKSCSFAWKAKPEEEGKGDGDGAAAAGELDGEEEEEEEGEGEEGLEEIGDDVALLPAAPPPRQSRKRKLAPVKSKLSVVLKNVNFELRRGDFVAVVGSVGAGKSSLVRAILGEMILVSGDYSCRDRRFSYFASPHWVLSATVRENILFGLPLDRRKYQKVVKSCQLESDLESFPDYDKTKVGEHGVRLSGGQRARIAIARACYCALQDDIDVFVFDDPLKDLDAVVCNAVFSEVFEGLLRHKTRILCTHNPQFLQRVDRVVVMRQGTIAQVGKVDAVDLEDILLHEDYASMRSPSPPQSPMTPSRTPGEEFLSPDGGAATAEVFKSQDHVSVKILFRYLLHDKRTFVVLLVLIAFKALAEIGRDYFLSVWSGDEDFKYMQFPSYVIVYLAIGVVTAAVIGISQVLLVYHLLTGAAIFHEKILQKVLSGTVPWFDKTNSGEIISRFSRDTRVMDDELRWRIREFAFVGSTLLVTVIFIFIAAPWFMLVALPLVGFSLWTARRFISAYGSLARMTADQVSPEMTHLNETASGLATIRAFNKQPLFVERHHEKVCHRLRGRHVEMYFSQWIFNRGRLVSALLLASFLIGGVLLKTSKVTVGLVAYKLIGMQFEIGWLSILVGMLTNNIQNLGRVMEYTTDVPSEEYDGQEIPDFPPKGHVEFRNVSFKYQSGDGYVLRQISFDVPAGTKIGICGRTGSGKSTLVKLLFRLYNLEPQGHGSIVVDDCPIADMSLSCLRTNLLYIAQNPTLLNGSVRENLDTAEQFSDAQLWSALELVGMKNRVEEMPEKMETKLKEDLKLSSGEKQLICFARAMLRRKMVLVLDEATSSCDSRTDAMIQSLVKDHFSDRTVIAIAHRLETVMDYDQILVLQDGRIAECGAPADLLKRPESQLMLLVRETGEERAHQLLRMAGLDDD